MGTRLHGTTEPGRASGSARWSPLTVAVPLDGTPTSAAGLPLARMLARTFGAALQRVTVEVGSGDAVGVVSVDGEAQFVLRGSGVGDALLSHLARQPVPLLCLATRARGGLHRRLTGNLVDHVVARSDCPIVVVGPGAQGEDLGSPPATILLAASDHLPAASTALAATWAMAMDADVVVATVLPPTGYADVASRAAFTGAGRPSGSDGFLGGVASFSAGPNDALLGPLVGALGQQGIASTGVILTGGTVATSLLAYAEALPGPVLLVAPVGDRDGRVPGDVTHQLLQRSRWPVVASLGATD